MNANYHKGAEQISMKEAFSTNKMVTTRLVRHEDAIYEKQSGRGTVVESAKSRVVAALLLPTFLFPQRPRVYLQLRPVLIHRGCFIAKVTSNLSGSGHHPRSS